MNFFEFLASNNKVETYIGLVSFIVAAILGLWAFLVTSKLKAIKDIVGAADTQSKADLAQAINNVLPTYRIPELTSTDGFRVVKLQLEQRAMEIKERGKTLRIGMVFLFLLMLAMLGHQLINFNTTTGKQSGIYHGDNIQINNNLMEGDTSK